MIQKMMIEVEAEKLLPEYGDRHMIIYDNAKKRYYVTTRENFLQEQNKKIETLETLVKNHELTMKKYIKNCDNQNKNFEEKMNEKFDAFIKQYTETNAKLIEMVKKVVVGG